MADAIVSVVLERIAALVEEKIRDEVNLVRGVKKEILRLSDDLNTVRNVLEDAEKKWYKEKSIKDWLTRLENTTHEMDDVLDESRYSILEFQMEESNAAAEVPRKQKKIVVRREIGLKIKQVKARLDLILAEKDRYGFAITEQSSSSSDLPHGESWRVQSTSLIDLKEVCGRESERETLVAKLVAEGSSEQEACGVCLLSVVGVGGLGKTTLAQLAYNDSRVKNCFELRIWICVSDPFDVFGIANDIIVKVGGSKPQDAKQLDMLLDCVTKSISRKKILLVLDDVWAEDDTLWKALKIALNCGGGLGSKVLVTTRNERVAIMMGASENGIHHLGHLSDKDCWLLLRRIALCGKNEEECERFDKIGKAIANKCRGLPFAAKTLASLLRFKKTMEEWESVLSSEIWELEKVEVELFPHLLLSYNELSPALKRCFSYCAVFPKDTRIDVETLITKWMALGYLGSNAGDSWKIRGREYFDNLAAHSLFQDFKKDGDDKIESFMMHDIVHDFAQFLRKNVGSRMEKTICQACSPRLVSQVKGWKKITEYRLPRYTYQKLPNKYRTIGCHYIWYGIGTVPLVYGTVAVLYLQYHGNTVPVRLLCLRSCSSRRIPRKTEKLIHLRWLDLGHNDFACDDGLKSICQLYNLQFLWVDQCELLEIPSEVGNLIHLIHLDLGYNTHLKELPESLCNLRELESLIVEGCTNLARLPQGIHKLVNLKHLNVDGTDSLKQFPQGLAHLTRLVALEKFLPCDGSRLGWLKNLNRLSGKMELELEIRRHDSVAAVVEDAREAELWKKMHVHELRLNFHGESSSPHPNLHELTIGNYQGPQLPQWIVSPLNQLTFIYLDNCQHLVPLPPLDKLPLLETLCIKSHNLLEFLGREFLGITATTTASSSAGTIIGGFPKLKKLTFSFCSKWKEWEDITAEEEHSEVAASLLIMPCLKELEITFCNGLRRLPHRLLRKIQRLNLE
ncbi:hypothetical protein ABFS82_01G097900 [Erythranthe guttata]